MCTTDLVIFLPGSSPSLEYFFLSQRRTHPTGRRPGQRAGTHGRLLPSFSPSSSVFRLSPSLAKCLPTISPVCTPSHLHCWPKLQPLLLINPPLGLPLLKVVSVAFQHPSLTMSPAVQNSDVSPHEGETRSVSTWPLPSCPASTPSLSCVGGTRSSCCTAADRHILMTLPFLPAPCELLLWP